MKIKKIIQSVLMVGLVQCAGLATVQAASVSKNAGPTTPVLSDFSSQAAGHPRKVGYNDNQQEGVEHRLTIVPKRQGVVVPSVWPLGQLAHIQIELG